MLVSAGMALHWAALALATAAVGCGLRRRRHDRVGAGIAGATGVVMLTAMADMAAGTMLFGTWTPLAWTGILLASGIAAAWAGRRGTAPVPAPDAQADGSAPLHLLHVTCLPVMAALTAAMAHHAPATSAGSTGGAHAHGGDLLTAVALVAATVHVVAGCSVMVVHRRRRLDRVEALAGAGSIAAMAAAAVL